MQQKCSKVRFFLKQVCKNKILKMLSFRNTIYSLYSVTGGLLVFLLQRKLKLVELLLLSFIYC